MGHQTGVGHPTLGPTGGGGGGGGGGGSLVLLSKAVLASVDGPFPFSCSFPGAQIGDKVVQCIDMTAVVDAGTHFETVVSAANVVKQLSTFPGAIVNVQILLRHG